MLVFIIIDNRISKIKHRFSGLEHFLHVVKPLVAVEEVVGHTVPGTIVLQTKVSDVFPIAGESCRTGLQFGEPKALWRVPVGIFVGTEISSEGMVKFTTGAS